MVGWGDLNLSNCANCSTRAARRAPRAAALPLRRNTAPLDLVAEVLAEIHGDPMGLMEGEPLRDQ